MDFHQYLTPPAYTEDQYCADCGICRVQEGIANYPRPVVVRTDANGAYGCYPAGNHHRWVSPKEEK